MPSGSKVPALLTPKVISMPSATGRSMLIRRCARSRHAVLKNGPQENNTTGSVSTHEAQRSSCAISVDKSPGAAT